MKFARTMTALTLVLGLSQVALSQDRDRAASEQQRRDDLKIAVQKICPVSGQKLGAHGKPIKVAIGKEHVFLCCKGCLKGKVDPKHWATIHANFAKAQGICPVMKHKLPKSPKWTIVEGQIVYICCPPCTKKIEADPKTFLQKLDALYSASLRTAAKQQPQRR